MNNTFFDSFLRRSADPQLPPRPPLKVSVRTFGEAIEEVLMTYTRVKLEVVLADELNLEYLDDDSPSDTGQTKRELIQAYTRGWKVPQLDDMS